MGKGGINDDVDDYRLSHYSCHRFCYYRGSERRSIKQSLNRRLFLIKFICDKLHNCRRPPILQKPLGIDDTSFFVNFLVISINTEY